MPYPDSGPDCPIAGCTSKRKPDQLMCSSCWRKVPQRQQQLVYQHWTRRKRGYDGAERDHEAAKKAAIAAVEGRG